MSAFFVSRQTVHDTVTLWTIYHRKPRPLSDLNAIGRALWAMNAEAIRQRYPSVIGTAEEREMSNDAGFYIYHYTDASPAQLAKSAHCLRYQCSEGDIGEGNARFDALYRSLDRMCEAVGEPDGFDDAEWDRCA